MTRLGAPRPFGPEAPELGGHRSSSQETHWASRPSQERFRSQTPQSSRSTAKDPLYRSERTLHRFSGALAVSVTAALGRGSQGARPRATTGIRVRAHGCLSLNKPPTENSRTVESTPSPLLTEPERPPPLNFPGVVLANNQYSQLQLRIRRRIGRTFQSRAESQ